MEASHGIRDTIVAGGFGAGAEELIARFAADRRNAGVAVGSVYQRTWNAPLLMDNLDMTGSLR
jgi:hypothetical protein